MKLVRVHLKVQKPVWSSPLKQGWMIALRRAARAPRVTLWHPLLPQTARILPRHEVPRTSGFREYSNFDCFVSLS